MQRGELYRIRKPPGDPKQHRIFLIVSRQWLIDSRFSTVMCAPVFTSGQGLTTQVSIGINEGMKHESWVFCDGLTSVRKVDLTHYVGLLSAAKMSEVEAALAMALDLRL